MGGGDLDGLLPTVRVGDPPEAKRAAYAALVAAAQAVLLAEGDDGGKRGAAAGNSAAAAAVDAVAALSTLAFLLSRALPHCSWSGFYRRSSAAGEGEDVLIVGPYCGTSMGCLRIPLGRGVCGAAARERRSQVVPDVAAFPGHIACSSATKSELVVPLFEGGDREGGRVAAVLDLDSEEAAAFDDEDARGLEALCGWVGAAFFPAAASPGAARRAAAG